MVNVGIIIQARLSSKRLPRKTEKRLTENNSLLDVCVLRAKKAGYTCIVAAPFNEKDDDYWKSFRRSDLYFGDSDNLLHRYYSVAVSLGFDVIVRLTGDNPFVSHEAIIETVNYLISNQLEYVTSKGDDGAWLPHGVGCEVFTIAALKKVVHEQDPIKMEHVSEAFLFCHDIRSAVLYKPFTWLAPSSRTFSLTIDTYSQLQMAKMCLETQACK